MVLDGGGGQPLPQLGDTRAGVQRFQRGVQNAQLIVGAGRVQRHDRIDGLVADVHRSVSVTGDRVGPMQ